MWIWSGNHILSKILNITKTNRPGFRQIAAAIQGVGETSLYVTDA